MLCSHSKSLFFLRHGMLEQASGCSRLEIRHTKEVTSSLVKGSKDKLIVYIDCFRFRLA